VAAVMPGLQSIPVPGLNPSSLTGAAKSEPVASIHDSIPSTPATVDIEAAPAADQITADVSFRPESLMPQVADSSAKKALKRILRKVSGAPAPEAKAAKQ
jgi:hypothetical protein